MQIKHNFWRKSTLTLDLENLLQLMKLMALICLYIRFDSSGVYEFSTLGYVPDVLQNSELVTFWFHFL